MSRREIKHSRRALTPEERANVAAARRLGATEEPEIRRKAKEYKRAYEEGRATLVDALKLLKAERERLRYNGWSE